MKLRNTKSVNFMTFNTKVFPRWLSLKSITDTKFETWNLELFSLFFKTLIKKTISKNDYLLLYASSNIPLCFNIYIVHLKSSFFSL